MSEHPLDIDLLAHVQADLPEFEDQAITAHLRECRQCRLKWVLMTRSPEDRADGYR